MTVPLRHRLEDYLALRRALGFRLVRQGALLAQFVTFAEAAGSEVVTLELALAWARQPKGANPTWVSRRLGTVRGFSRHLAVLDPTSEVIAADLVVVAVTRPTPYLYSPEEITALMETAKESGPPVESGDLRGLPGPARLHRDARGRSDAPRPRRLRPRHRAAQRLGLQVRQVPPTGPPSRARWRPCAATSVVATGFAHRPRPQHFSSPAPAGVSATPCSKPAFRDLLRRSGVGASSPRRPRVHDLRHSFCVTSLLRWYRENQDVAANMPALSTYLGHVNINSTYWYLSGAPELLRLAADRLEATFGGGL